MYFRQQKYKIKTKQQANKHKTFFKWSLKTF
nr:MAG TPA: hypothetical protein [Caudoviricetes sp.]DAK60166.1 MAG TPA: hypothetical protein [Caudoviricetes sp.]DAU51172.1 MAG TPA: hypothetical protein [Caudoviricetes sp.]